MGSRRQRGEGSITEYATTNGPRFSVRFAAPQPDGTIKRTQKRGFGTKKEAAKYLREQLRAIDKGAYVPPSRLTVEAWSQQWLSTRRLRDSTRASYSRVLRLHILPSIGSKPLEKVTAADLDTMYRALETGGFRRADNPGTPLSARTVQYAATITSAMLSDAVNAGLLVVNPAEKAHPPSAAEARAPEQVAWTTEQAAAFLGWVREHRDGWQVWHLLLFTGLRRGELAGLRWSDIDLEHGTISVRRSIHVVVEDGHRHVRTGPTKTGKSRVVDIDAGTVAMLRGWRRDRGAVHLNLVRPDTAVFGDLAGAPVDPDTLTARFRRHLEAAQAALPDAHLPRIRVHDLRHTHATALLRIGTPVKVVSERLGHTDATTTLRVYQHVLPGMQKAAADSFSALFG